MSINYIKKRFLGLSKYPAGYMLLIPIKKTKGYVRFAYNMFIMPIAFCTFGVSKKHWIYKVSEVGKPIWVLPSQKMTEQAEDGHADGHGWTAGCLLGHAKELYHI